MYVLPTEIGRGQCAVRVQSQLRAQPTIFLFIIGAMTGSFFKMTLLFPTEDEARKFVHRLATCGAFDARVSVGRLYHPKAGTQTRHALLRGGWRKLFPPQPARCATARAE